MKNGNQKEQEIRIAVFGESGCGKTTLLSSFYSKQRSYAQDQEKDYYLLADDASQGRGLLRDFYRMKDEGLFPEGTDRFSEYSFSFFVSNFEEPSLKIRWYDYPGKWWTNTPSDTEELADQRKCLSCLLESHIGLLIVDGQKFLENGGAYIRTLFAQFFDEIKRQKQEINRRGMEVQNYPDQWIIALSKADLFPENYSAEDFQSQIIKEAHGSCKNLAEFLKGGQVTGQSNYKSYQFGSQYLLLSSAKARNGIIKDSSETLGLELIVPMTLNSSLRKVAEEAPKGALLGIAGGFLASISSLINLINKSDDFLPKKYQLITQLLDIIKVEEISKEGAGYMKRRQDEMIKKGRKIEAAVYAMQRELKRDNSKRLFYCDQIIRIDI